MDQSLGDALADGGYRTKLASDAYGMWGYAKTCLRTAVWRGLRRWPVMIVILALHLALWVGLVRLTRHEFPQPSADATISIEFIPREPESSEPRIDISPLRREIAPAQTAQAPTIAPSVNEAPPILPEPPPRVTRPRPRLFRPDGSPNLPEDVLSDVDRRIQEDGSAEYRIADLDRAGHFDPRPVLTYEETVFERYWVPSESLLEEWVRRGIKKVSIPIPGTNQRITCFISLVAPGAACGVTRPRQLNAPVEVEYQPPPNRNLLTE